MKKYYFTYGTSENYPYQGGWTEVEAESRTEACKAFRAVHPDRIPSIINCASIYTHEQFINTEMYKHGNLGLERHELIIAAEVVK